MSKIIALLTDFGTQDIYVGVMKGVMAGICPDATLIDLTHEILPHSVRQGALALVDSYKYFPKGTVFLCVVDPGVGSHRRAVAVKAGGYTFIAPDNGLLSYTLMELKEYEAVTLENPAYQNKSVSASFHGRDIFAPAAAHLATGTVALSEFGTHLGDLFQLRHPQIHVEEDRIIGEVTHIDHFGNLNTSIGKLARVTEGRIILRPVASTRTVRLQFVEHAEIRIFSEVIHGIGDAFYESPRGELMAKINSNGYMEIAINQGNAAERLGVTIGDEVTLMMPEDDS
ncbi:MAG: SAM hydrolase/SAM-dependent halogenase family protein [Aggregatilineales bacterium]